MVDPPPAAHVTCVTGNSVSMMTDIDAGNNMGMNSIPWSCLERMLLPFDWQVLAFSVDGDLVLFPQMVRRP